MAQIIRSLPRNKTARRHARQRRFNPESQSPTLSCFAAATDCFSRKTILQVLASTLEIRDAATKAHSERVAAYCARLGRQMGLTAGELEDLRQGALLHDIGKIGVSDSILLKRGTLSGDEWARMREHIDHGLRIVAGVGCLCGAVPVIAQHHEKYDGSGYPLGLSGAAIHVNARVFAVADAFDAMTSDRPYRAALSYEYARAEIIAQSGAQFDPAVVCAFLSVGREEWAEIRRRAAE